MMDNSTYLKVKVIMDEYGVPTAIWYPIMLMESGGNPKSHNPKGEDSRGVFQINLYAHPQWSNLNLYDPEINARIAAENFLLPAYKKAQDKGLTSTIDQAEYVWRYGIRPKWTVEKANSIRQAASSFSLPTGSVEESPAVEVNTPTESYWQKWLKYQKLLLAGKWTEAEAYRAGWTVEGTGQIEKDISEEATENVEQGNNFLLDKFQQIVILIVGIVMLSLGILVLSRNGVKELIK